MCSGCGTYSSCKHAVHWFFGTVALFTLLRSMGVNFLWAHAVTLFTHAPRAVLAPLFHHLGLLVCWQRQIRIIRGHVPYLATSFFDRGSLGCFSLFTCTGELLLWEEELSPGHPLIPAHQCLVLHSFFVFQLFARQLFVLQMSFPVVPRLPWALPSCGIPLQPRCQGTASPAAVRGGKQSGLRCKTCARLL